MHPMYTRGFDRCLTRVSPSVAAMIRKGGYLIYQRIAKLIRNKIAFAWFVCGMYMGSNIDFQPCSIHL